MRFRKVKRDSVENAVQSQNVLRQLFEAEQRTKDTINAARTRRNENFKKAKSEAQVDIDAFENEMAEKMKSDAQQLENEQKEEFQRVQKETADSINRIDQLARTNKEKTMAFILDLILNTERKPADEVTAL